MLTFTQFELELIYQGLKSFINHRKIVSELLDVKENDNQKYNQYIDLMNKILEKIENEYEN